MDDTIECLECGAFIRLDDEFLRNHHACRRCGEPMTPIIAVSQRDATLARVKRVPLRDREFGETAGYRAAPVLTLVLRALLCVLIAFSIGLFSLNVTLLMTPTTRLLTAIQEAETSVRIALPFILITAVLEGIVLLVWMVRMHRNASAISPRPLTRSDSECVWWWFVPFANLYFPYACLREIWDASSDHTISHGPVTRWWLLHVVFLFARVAERAALLVLETQVSASRQEALNIVRVGLMLAVAAVIIGVLSDVALWLMVGRLTAIQDRAIREAMGSAIKVSS